MLDDVEEEEEGYAGCWGNGKAMVDAADAGRAPNSVIVAVGAAELDARLYELWLVRKGCDCWKAPAVRCPLTGRTLAGEADGNCERLTGRGSKCPGPP